MTEIEHRGGWTLIRLAGLIEGPGLDALGECIGQLQRLDERNLRFDLSEVDFINSDGLDLLDAASGYALGRGGRMQVMGASARVRKLFELVDMDRLLVTDDEPPAGNCSAGPLA